MGAPDWMHAAEQPAAETLLTAFRTIKVAERQRHGHVLDYWRSIRGDKDSLRFTISTPSKFPIRGQARSSSNSSAAARRRNPSSRRSPDGRRRGSAHHRRSKSLHPVVHIQEAPDRGNLARIPCFRGQFRQRRGLDALLGTLLPLSSCGSWVDYVYAFVSVETARQGCRTRQFMPEVAPAPRRAPAEECVPRGRGRRGRSLPSTPKPRQIQPLW